MELHTNNTISKSIIRSANYTGWANAASCEVIDDFCEYSVLNGQGSESLTN
jgi:hypothetical protein